jgi:hypothetical protein
MQIVIERVGGFAGIAEPITTYDTNDLSPTEASAVTAALTTLQNTPSEEIGADLLNYRITTPDRIYEVPVDPPPSLASPLSVLLRSS